MKTHTLATAAVVVAASLAHAQNCRWEAVGTLPSHANALAVHDPDGPGGESAALYAAHFVTGPAGGFASQVVRWSGQVWSNVGAAMDRQVYRLISFDDGTGAALYAMGQFGNVGNTPARALAKWDGTAWSEAAGGATFTSTLGVTGAATLVAAAVFDDGTGEKLIVAGSFFNRAGGATPVAGIASWDGMAWSNMSHTGPIVRVADLAVVAEPSGHVLYAGGQLQLVAGVPVSGVARWNGTAWSAVGTPPSGFAAPGGPVALAAFDDGDGPMLHAAGPLLNFGFFTNHLIRWNGTSWMPAGPGEDANIQRLGLFDEGRGTALYAAGDFATLPAAHIARWNGVAWSALDAGVQGQPEALVSFDDGQGPALFVAGVTSAGGIAVNNVAAWRCGCYSDCARDGNQNVLDFVCFLNRFAADDPYADCDDNSTLDVLDFICFLNRFAAGCS